MSAVSGPMLDLLLEHIDGVEVPYLARGTVAGLEASAASTRRATTGALILRKMIRPDRPDRPRWTVITPRGREHLAAALSQAANRLRRAGYRVAPIVNDFSTTDAASSLPCPCCGEETCRCDVTIVGTEG